MNVLDGTRDGLLSLYCQEAAHTAPFPSLVFLDIGGNREAEDVRALVPILMEVFSPRQIIIKSEHVYEILKRQRWGGDAGASRASGGGVDVFESSYFSTKSTRSALDVSLGSSDGNDDSEGQGEASNVVE